MRGHASESDADIVATAAQIVALLGEVEPVIVEKLLAAHATLAELTEAVSALEDEDAFGEQRVSTPRAAEMRGILEELVLADV
jgi:hypothetical protein